VVEERCPTAELEHWIRSERVTVEVAERGGGGEHL
jgi:hypothetical protein